MVMWDDSLLECLKESFLPKIESQLLESTDIYTAIVMARVCIAI